jgi:hypothetical protein
VLIDEAFSARLKILEPHLGQQSIRNHQQTLLECSQLDGAQPDIFDDAELSPYFAKVTNV